MSKQTKRNPVAKHLRAFNQPAIHVDQKKASKKGARKHKGQEYSQAA